MSEWKPIYEEWCKEHLVTIKFHNDGKVSLMTNHISGPDVGAIEGDLLTAIQVAMKCRAGKEEGEGAEAIAMLVPDEEMYNVREEDILLAIAEPRRNSLGYILGWFGYVKIPIAVVQLVFEIRQRIASTGDKATEQMALTLENYLRSCRKLG